MFTALGALASGIFGVVKTWFHGRQAKAKAKQALALAKLEAKTKHIQQMDAADAAWNIKALETAGWRDEYLTIVLSIPLILVFIPQLVPYIKDGFAALNSLPDWYRYSIMAMIGSAFGVQKLVGLASVKKAMT